jgi:hypothetical protein
LGIDGVLNTGFASLDSSQPVNGGSILFEFGNFGDFVIAQAGVPASVPLMRQTTFATMDDGEDTGVAVANPGTNAVTITFQLRDRSGVAVLPSVNRTLAANGHTSFFISQLFPAMAEGFLGTLQITSSTPVVTTAVIFLVDERLQRFRSCHFSERRLKIGRIRTSAAQSDSRIRQDFFKFLLPGVIPRAILSMKKAHPKMGSNPTRSAWESRRADLNR